MKNILLFIFASITLTIVGCASVEPNAVPLIKSKALSAIELASLQPKSIDLVVKNTRKINQDANNSKDVEEKIFSVISDSLAKSNISIDHNAKTRLYIEISDYTQSHNEGECVQLQATCTLRRGMITVKSYSCYDYRNVIFGASMGGDISKAYQMGLNNLIKELNEQAQKYASWF